MSEVRHIEIIEIQTDSDGNYLQTIDEEDDEEVEEVMFLDQDDYEFVTPDNNGFEQSGKF